MSMITIDTEVDIDTASIIDEITTDELLDELNSRDINQYSDADRRGTFEALYYALRDGNLNKSIELINPLLEDIIGRRV